MSDITEVKTYRIWKDADPNEWFEVKAPDVYEAAFGALDELGWCVSTRPETAPAPYVVLYVVTDETLKYVPEAFTCIADNDEHAEEQCRDAYPDCDVVWVVEGTDVDHAYSDYWGYKENA